jgi:hypothetical protein
MPAVQDVREKDDLRLEALRSAPLNSWVALSEDETKIVAVGSTYEEVVRNSEKVGVQEPLILRTPPSWVPLSVLTLENSL